MIATKLCLVVCIASASALKVATTSPLLKSTAPLPPSAETALALRGGGMVDAGIWLKAASAFFGLYGIGFLLAPELTMTQNFVLSPDKYHTFMARNIGVMVLFSMYLLNFAVELSVAVPALVVFMGIAACVGPVYAELKLETTPAHKAALLMVPFIVTGLMAL